MNNLAFLATKSRLILAISLVVGSVAGCGAGGSDGGDVREFEQGYDDGFADDSEYHLGFDDSLYTVGVATLYQGGDIPFIDDFSYEAGYYDGLFDAYNDGYFVAYRFAFVIGFSEGYDNAFWPDYLDFLVADMHVEYLNGGFSDGYDDGFSEGRVFGAFDYEVFLPFDWLDALFDWESGTDIVFDEIGVGTGGFGPVTFYEWGTDPHLLRSDDQRRSSMRSDPIALRPGATRSHELTIERPLTASQAQVLDQTPTTTPRTNRILTIPESWLERIEAYSSAFRSSAEARTPNVRRDSSRVRLEAGE